MTNTTTTLTVLGCATAAGKGICTDCGAAVPDYCGKGREAAPEAPETAVETPVPSTATDTAETPVEAATGETGGPETTAGEPDATAPAKPTKRTKA